MYRIALVCLFPLGLLAQSPFVDRSDPEVMAERAVARGVSICDYNEDGRPDIYVSFRDAPNVLYGNDGNFAFTEVAAEVGLAEVGPSSFSLWADFDNDGHQEVFIGNREAAPMLYRLGPGGQTKFIPTPSPAFTAQTPYAMTGVAFDYNGDQLLDIYLACLGCENLLYRNLGNLQFELVGGAAGAEDGGLAMGVSALDYDLDGDSDLYLVHDGQQPNRLYRNDGGRFTDVSRESGMDVIGDGMGVDVHDYDLDGLPDVYVSNLFENFLLRNNGDGTFSERAFDTQTNDLGMGWGTAWLDYDNDGDPDLYVANETNFNVGGRTWPNLLYRNEGDGTFSIASTEDEALASPFSGYGAAVADFDGDGREDIVVANSRNYPTQVFRNEMDGGGDWLGIRLRGSVSNRDGIGSRIVVHTDRGRLERQLLAGGSFASQHGSETRFGLGARRVDSISVFWPSGNYQVYPPAVNTTLLLEEGTIVSAREVGWTVMELYPNPVGERVTFSTDVGAAELRTSGGRRVWAGRIDGREWSVPRFLPPGLYLLRLPEQRAVARLVVVK